MNKFIIALSACVLVAAAIPAAADAQVRVGLGGGPAFPLDHLADEATTGFHVQGSLGLELPLLPFGVRADGLWQRYPADHEGSFNGIGGLLNATVRLPMMPVARPYLVGGVGAMRYKEPEIDHGDHAHGGESETEFAFGVGAGVGIRLLGLGGFMEARYLDWGHGNRAIPVTLGITF
jgi:opacity protein-like surface antigen